MIRTKSIHLMAFAILLFAIGCSEKDGKPAAEKISMDGSSTVYPLSEAVVESFSKGDNARVTVGVSGTGGGFKKFCAGEMDLVGASRPIKSVEKKACEKLGIEFVEMPVAYDGIVVVVNPQNAWANDITVEELKKIWAPESQGKVMRWSQVRDGWPDEEIRLFGPGVDSGTYDYFTKAIVGKEHASRGDFTSSEDDNVLVQGVATDKNALGFFGFAYYTENKDRLKALTVAGVKPTMDTIRDASYAPLSRPIFIYARAGQDRSPALTRLVHAYLKTAPGLAADVGYVPLPAAVYEALKVRFDQQKKGSAYDDAKAARGQSIEILYGAI
jgi:phosphate transport system substrate-binding protein